MLFKNETGCNFFFILLGACASNSIFAQDNNRLSIQTGLFHCFFDKSPILNVNYLNKSEKPFRGLLYNSLGLQYLRKINQLNFVSVEYMMYYETYQNVHPNLLKNVVRLRNYNSFNVTYERNLPIKSNLSFTYGSGVNCRFGYESIVVNYGYFGYLNGWEPLIEVREVGDVGINLRTGIEYSPLKWLTLYSKFDLIGFVYIHDKKAN